MFFLVKCLACIALVLVALQWRGADEAPRALAQRSRAVSAGHAPQKAQMDAAARGLVQAGADALVSAARERCLAAPRDCAAALQRLNGPERDRR
ncbi:MAG: hypothetical protein CTY15_06665 [Methylocystis sp.]|nr:MAG: hypothetical protein CTY15_06665 [Methylocystis sp.]